MWGVKNNKDYIDLKDNMKVLKIDLILIFCWGKKWLREFIMTNVYVWKM